jgi:tetratricopeptide (TPR) repeat protein
MVSQNGDPSRPNQASTPSPEDLAGAESALSQEYMTQFQRAIELGKAGDLEGAANVARKAIKASEAQGGIQEASVILTFLPALFPASQPNEALKLAYRVVELAEGRPHCEYLVSNARFFSMQALIKEDQKPAALKEAEACVVAGKASRTHCKWLATAWRYYGMLLALNGKMPEALLALSNAIDLAKSKPTDDSLALARAHDAMGRTLVEMNNVELGLKELKKAYEVFKVRGVADGQEALATWNVIKQLRPDI